MLRVVDYKDIQYKKHGRSRHAGCDCYGLLRLIYLEELGIDLPLYPNRELGEAVIEERERAWGQISKEEAKEYDVVLLHKYGRVCHLGIIASKANEYMIHLGRGHGVMIEAYSSPRWKNRVEGFYRCRSRM